MAGSISAAKAAPPVVADAPLAAGAAVAATTDAAPLSTFDQLWRDMDIQGRGVLPRLRTSEVLIGLDYDLYRQVRFLPEKRLWQEAGEFQLDMFHPGYLFEEPVQLFQRPTGATGGWKSFEPIEFSTSLYRYDWEDFTPEDVEFGNAVGFAGFRLWSHYGANEPFEEVVAFLGASYFRAIGDDHNYGISARGLAINTGLPQPEEFPVFREFYLERPAPDAKAARFWAVMDSKSVGGLYQFTVHPGKDTVLDVQARVVIREPIEKLGLGPLTSMWQWGDGVPKPASDFRPEVHDSDGLLMEMSTGEWIWRPLCTPRVTSVSSFNAESPRGFGLMQRDREYEHYQDDEARYHLRPSLWVAPHQPLGPGSVELLEIVSPGEYVDSIAAYFRPEPSPAPGTVLDLDYSLTFGWNDPGHHTGGRCHESVIERNPDGSAKFTLTFRSETLKNLPPETPVMAELSPTSVVTSAPIVFQTKSGDWQVSFQANPPDVVGPGTVLRLSLRNGPDYLSETWVYSW